MKKRIETSDCLVVIRDKLHVWGRESDLVDDNPMHIAQVGLTPTAAFQYCLDRNFTSNSEPQKPISNYQAPNYKPK